jgi:hypothetical protein
VQARQGQASAQSICSGTAIISNAELCMVFSSQSLLRSHSCQLVLVEQRLQKLLRYKAVAQTTRSSP